MDGEKLKILELAEQHPHILLGACVALVIILIIVFVQSRGWLDCKKKRSSTAPLDDDEEFDGLIKSINSQQTKKK